MALGESFSSLHERLVATRDPAAVREILRTSEARQSPDRELRVLIDGYLNDGSNPWLEANLRAKIRAAAEAESLLSQAPQDVAKPDVRKASQGEVYTDIGARDSGNWFGRSFEELGRLLSQIRMPSQESPDVPEEAIETASRVFTFIAWGLLGLLALAGLIVAIRYAQLKLKKSSRSLDGLMTEAEAQLESDEWLELAKAAEQRGDYREAVRCVYLAHLVRLDRARWLELIRSETNWEHARRFQRSSQGRLFNLHPITATFDAAWYGQHPVRPEQCREGVASYEQLLDAIATAKRGAA